MPQAWELPTSQLLTGAWLAQSSQLRGPALVEGRDLPSHSLGKPLKNVYMPNRM